MKKKEIITYYIGGKEAKLIVEDEVVVTESKKRLNFIELRESRGFGTQKELAAAMNIEKSTVGKWETNAAIPRFHTMQKLAELFNCELGDITNCFRKSERE